MIGDLTETYGVPSLSTCRLYRLLVEAAIIFLPKSLNDTSVNTICASRGRKHKGDTITFFRGSHRVLVGFTAKVRLHLLLLKRRLLKITQTRKYPFQTYWHNYDGR